MSDVTAYSQLDAAGNRVYLTQAQIQAQVAASAAQGAREAAAQTTGSPTLAPAAGSATANGNAQAQMQATLNQWGLGSLAGQVYGWLTAGYDMNYVVQQIRNTPEYKARFPAMAERQKAGKPAISESDYLGLERSYDSVMHANGLVGYFGRDIYNRWIAGDVSPSEANDRAKAAYAAALGEPVEVRAELQRLYGQGAGAAATAWWLDPKNALPEIQRRLVSGEIAGASVRTGYGLLTAAEAQQLASEGVTGTQAGQGFSALGHEQELFGLLPGESGSVIGREQQLGAAFEGDSDAQRAIERRAQQRAAQFGGGGGYARTRQGVGGLGVAQ